MSFFGFPYPTRMAVVRLSTGNVCAGFPIALTEELANAIVEAHHIRFLLDPCLGS